MRESLTRSRRSKEQIGTITHQERESSFNNQSSSNQPGGTSKPIVMRHNESISNESMSRRKSIAESPLVMEQESKRFTRNFKKV